MIRCESLLSSRSRSLYAFAYRTDSHLPAHAGPRRSAVLARAGSFSCADQNGFAGYGQR
jgi:hypothetical protein